MTDEIIFCDSPEEVAEAATELIFEKQTEAVADRGIFRIALSGGSTPRLLYKHLASEEWREEMSWEHWEVYWSDERAVPPDHPDSNYHLAHTTLLSRVPVRKVYRMEADAPDLQRAAREYASFLPEKFDLILLGLGSDGHTASLFPDHPALSSDKLVEVVTLDSSLIPHPSSLPRLTLTYPVLNAARTVVLLIIGEEKAQAIKQILEFGNRDLPATRVKPEAGECFWILDDEAAHLLE